MPAPEPLPLPPPSIPAGRRAVFRALVEVADKVHQLGTARSLVADIYHISVAEVTAIEQEGVEKDWPPG